MKKMLRIYSILFVCVLMFLGCGQKENGVETARQYGNVVLRIRRNPEGALNKIPVNATNLTIRIYDDNRNMIKDFALSETIESTFVLPVGGYVVDGVATEKVTYKRLLLTSGRSNFDVVANQTTTVNLTLNSYQVDWTGTDTERNEEDVFAVRIRVTGSDLLSDRAYIETGWQEWTVDGKPPYSRPIPRTQLSVVQSVDVNGDAVYDISGDLTVPTISNDLPLVSPKPMYYQVYIYAKNDYRVDSIPLLYLPSLASGESLRVLNIIADSGSIIINVD